MKLDNIGVRQAADGSLRITGTGPRGGVYTFKAADGVTYEGAIGEGRQAFAVTDLAQAIELGLLEETSSDPVVELEIKHAAERAALAAKLEKDTSQ